MSTSQSQASASNVHTAAHERIEKKRFPDYIANAFFLLWLLLALAAPWWTKAAVLMFRIIAVLWVIALCVRLIKPRQAALTAPILAFVAWTALSSALSYAPAASWGRMRGIAMALMAIILPQTITQAKKLQWVAAALLFSTATIALFTFWQYVFGVGVRVKQITPALTVLGIREGDVIHAINGHRVTYSQQAVDEMVRNSPAHHKLEIWRGAPFEYRDVYATSAELAAAGINPQMLASRARPERAQGMFSQYVVFAEFLMIVAAVAFGMAIAASGRRRWILLPTFCVICGALVLTETRAAWMALLLGCAAALWIDCGKRARILIAIVCAGVLVASFIVFQRARQLKSIEYDPGTEYRLLMWKDGLRLAREHPVFGVGMDSIFSHAREWNIEAYERFPSLKSHFHSVYIEIAAESGIPALAIWLWILWSLGACSLYRAKHLGNFSRSVGLGGWALLIAFGLVSLVHYTLGDSEVMVIFWAIAGGVDGID